MRLRGPGALWAGIIALCVVGAVAAAVLISGLSTISDHDSQDGDRRDALAAAQHYVLTFDSIDPRNAASAKAAIEPLLTTKAKTAFDQQTDQWAQMLEELKQAEAATPSAGASPSGSPSGVVRYGAINAITVDTATALVADDAGIPAANKVIPYRWEIQLRKISGKWLVDDVQRIQ